MQTTKRTRILREQKEKALKELKENQDLIMGSLVYLNRRCGTDKKYGAYFLSRKEKGNTRLTYIPRERVEEIREKVERYKRVKKMIKRISEINIKIFKGGSK